jgi:NADP-dependent 3-hydroxy acid dehydrogenase YdfG
MENLKEYLPESLEGKNVIVTGGTTGIGRAIVLLLAKCGANVLFFGRHEQELKDTLNEIESIGGTSNIYGLMADVSKNEDIERVFSEASDKFDKLDILINNAALGYGSIQDGEYEDIQYLINTNLVGYLACASKAVERMKPNKSGHIVNIGSMSADVREKGSSVYVATKSGIQGFSSALRKEVNEDGIKVTVVEPGAVVTDMQELEKDEEVKNVEELTMMKPEDIAISVYYCLTLPKRCDVVELKVRPHLQII